MGFQRPPAFGGSCVARLRAATAKPWPCLLHRSFIRRVGINTQPGAPASFVGLQLPDRRSCSVSVRNVSRVGPAGAFGAGRVARRHAPDGGNLSRCACIGAALPASQGQKSLAGPQPRDFPAGHSGQECPGQTNSSRRSGQVEAIEIHHLAPRSDKVLHEHKVRVSGRIDLGKGS